MHEFTVWAPHARKVAVKIGEATYPMRGPSDRGWWNAAVEEAGAGTDYGFVLDEDAIAWPDPRSQWQPNGVHGASRVYDQSAFVWSDGGWQAPPLARAVIYELHVGTFTPRGTFDSAIEWLDYLAELGITHVELMPVAAFPGAYGWGYDGASLFAVTDLYGGPDGLKRLVDASHARGLAVLLDVVYNHFGPVGNYSGNDAVRVVDGVRAVVNVTSDKCYENREWDWGYREGDPMGGFDPYSSSKGCAELVTQAFRRSYFADPGAPRIASARAGNVIGGGDWGEDRLIPDLMRAALDGSAAHVRNPDAIRPWQHVLNPLSGYLVLAQALSATDVNAGAWNFGPPEEDARPVGWIAARVAELWPDELRWEHDPGPHPHEARYLKLDSSMARARLGWQPPIRLDRALEATVDWYRELAEGADMQTITVGQIEALQHASRST